MVAVVAPVFQRYPPVDPEAVKVITCPWHIAGGADGLILITGEGFTVMVNVCVPGLVGQPVAEYVKV